MACIKASFEGGKAFREERIVFLSLLKCQRLKETKRN
jgi:hypothetical protein